jgi:hypothetical protein
VKLNDPVIKVWRSMIMITNMRNEIGGGILLSTLALAEDCGYLYAPFHCIEECLGDWLASKE